MVARESFTAAINGLQFKVQATDYDDVEYNAIYETYTNNGSK